MPTPERTRRCPSAPPGQRQPPEHDSLAGTGYLWLPHSWPQRTHSDPSFQHSGPRACTGRRRALVEGRIYAERTTPRARLNAKRGTCVTTDSCNASIKHRFPGDQRSADPLLNQIDYCFSDCGSTRNQTTGLLRNVNHLPGVRYIREFLQVCLRH